MISKLLGVFALGAILAVAAEDPWAKVQKLESGQELRIRIKSTTKPVEARFAELTEESLVVVDKDTQRAIGRDTIDGIDARPAKARPRIKTETKVEQRPPGTGMTPGERNTSRQSESTSSGLSFEGKPGFENVYRRPPGRVSP